MIPPASEMAIRSSIVTGNIENATAAAPELTAASSALVPRRAAEEVDSLVGPDIADPQDLLEHEPLQKGDVQSARP